MALLRSAAMPALLAPGHREAVLWQEDVPTEELAPNGSDGGPPPSEVDVLVVGAGFCGLAAAAELARRGRSVAVLERDPIGRGASTRNAGMVLPELKAGPGDLAARYGELGRRLHDEVESAFDHVESMVGDRSGSDYERTGQLLCTFGRRGEQRLRSLAEQLEQVGDAARVVDGDDLEAEAGSRRFRAGLVVERSGGLHPARFHSGLVVRARDEGVALHDGRPVRSISSVPGGRWRVRHDGGDIDAGEVLLATNAEVDGVSRWLRRRVLPMGSFIVATEPLAPELAATVLPTRRMAFTDRNLLWYWRHGPGGRLLFGGRKRLGRVELAEARDHLYGALLEAHPQLRGVRLERSWGGRVALTLDRLPHCGRVDGMWFATGCNGSGVATNTWLGHRMAAAICGEPLPAFAELAMRPIPLRSVRAAWLPVAGAWLRSVDWWSDQ